MASQSRSGSTTLRLDDTPDRLPPDRLPSPAPASPPSRGVKRERSVFSESEFEETEGARPTKQLKRHASTLLSEENLREFEAQTMSNKAPQLKRIRSRPSTAQSDITSSSCRTLGSSINPSAYRYQHLKAAKICITPDLPDDVKAAVDAIIGRKLTNERRALLKDIAREFCSDSNDLIRASDGKDDSVRVLLKALAATKKSALRYQEKADWREELKPVPPQPLFDADFLKDPTVSDPTPARKRPQKPTDSSRPSTTDPIDTSQVDPPHVSNMMPPPAGPVSMDKEGERSSIKTPRPDISIGIAMTELTSRLASRLNTARANELLPWLQDAMKRPDKPDEPLLISVPASRASDLAFPFAIVEGKAYSTGKPVFDAENQAATAGACALKMQLDLEDLASRSRKHSDAPSSSSPTPPLLFFSVCTEGPYHALYAHWTLDEDGVPTFCSIVRKICHGCLVETVEDFLIAFDNVCSWGTGQYLDYVVESLVTIAIAAFKT
ncbi:hypothetical protein MMC29_002878 [Sticta canariensis]|nr:hypothetical protein [Sticta canariensis]